MLGYDIFIDAKLQPHLIGEKAYNLPQCTHSFRQLLVTKGEKVDMLDIPDILLTCGFPAA
jgi:hypothetical protein